MYRDDFEYSVHQTRAEKESEEKRGCNLEDFYRKAPMGQLFSTNSFDAYGDNYQAHWNLAGDMCKKKRDDLYCGIDYSTFTPNPVNCDTYKIPDKCSRAILSELSTVYNGKAREQDTTLLTGAALLCKTWSPTCKSNYENQDKVAATLKNIFGKRIVKSTTCWGFVDDWRDLYCKKYSKCVCEDDTDENCHENADKIRCCDDLYQDFLQGPYVNSSSLSQLNASIHRHAVSSLALRGSRG